MVSSPQLVAARALFPVTRRYAYLNVAAVAPLADPVANAMIDYVNDLREHGAVHYLDWFTVFREARELSARLLGATPGEIAFVRNTSEGINIVSTGLGLGAGDSVVIVHGDFPANVHPWLRLRDQGVDVRVVRPDEWNRVTPEQLLLACDETTRLVSTSLVSFSNGYRLDVAALARRLHARGILLFVDAIQGVGCLSLDVRETGIDFLAADSHKWMLGPEGIGLFYIRADLLDRIRPPFVSWLSMKDPFDITHYRGDLHDDARRFEFATPNTCGIHAMRAALQLLLEVGVEQIEAHVLALTDHLCEGLRMRKMVLRTPRGDQERSGIVSFEHRSRDAESVVKHLEEAGVIAAARGGGARVAVHLYNDEADIERLLAALP